MHLCGISLSTEGVSGIALGLKEDFNQTSKEEMASTFLQRELEQDKTTITPKRYRAESTREHLKKFLNEGNKRKMEINEKR